MIEIKDSEIYDFFQSLKIVYRNENFYQDRDDMRIPIPKTILIKFIRECKSWEEVARNILEKAKLIKKRNMV